MKRLISLTILTGVLIALLAIFFNLTVTTKKSNVVITGNIVTLCERNFISHEISSAPAGVSIAKKTVTVPGLPIPALVPINILKDNPTLEITAEVRSAAVLPLLPDLPIFPTGKQALLCPLVKQYADGYSKAKSKLINAYTSKVFQLTTYGSALSITLKTGYQEAVTQFSQQSTTNESSFKTSITKQYQQNTNGSARTIPQYKFIIIYQNGYGTEANDLVNFYSQSGIITKAIELSQLPGYYANDPIPDECNGEFLKECYHFWGDPVPGVSQLAVPSLPGFVKQTTAFQQYEKVPYVPGLIRAYIRKMNNTNPLRGVLLVGSVQKIPPYNTTKQAYYYDGVPWIPGVDLPTKKLFTDLYYSLPNVPVYQSSTSLAHEIMTPNIWSCSGPNGIRLDYYCKNDEWRYWSTPPLDAYRNPAHVPHGKAYDLKYGYSDSYWSTVNYSEIVPVGRIVTQERFLKTHDPVAARYVQKLKRWYNEMPSMKNNSINSNAGSTSDTWIYSKEDIDQFQLSFGALSKVYASEFFVSSAKCAGRCVYENGERVMSQMSRHNSVAFFLNGHGGHIAIQAPYGNGNVASSYMSESSVYFNDGIRLMFAQYPSTSTIKQVNDSRRLIGVIFANSCSPSNYLLANELHVMNKSVYPAANERSWAEQWIAMDDAGAVNTFLNSDVGFGGSDNNFNVAFMKRMTSAWYACGTIGDAQRKTILDAMRYGNLSNIGEWQIYNRKLLGSPLNHFAKLPFLCNTIVGRTNFVEKDGRQ